MSAVVIEVLREAFRRDGAPAYVRSDYGPEFIAEAVPSWLPGQWTKTHSIDPASPWQNAFGESFNDKLLQECLNVEGFERWEEAKVIMASVLPRAWNSGVPGSSGGHGWMRDYVEPVGGLRYSVALKVGSTPPPRGGNSPTSWGMVVGSRVSPSLRMGKGWLRAWRTTRSWYGT
jgi:transposase InsO family protein